MEYRSMKITRVAPSSNSRRSRRAPPHTQKGVVLFIALIVLVAMTLAGISLVRSVDTANVIAGNLAFKQGALQAADIGVEAAVAALPTIVTTTLDTVVNPPPAGPPNYWYYPSRRETDVYGVPTTKEAGTTGGALAINWANVPIASTVAGNDVQIVIDRLCTGPIPVSDLQGKCFAESTPGGGSKKWGAPVFTSTTNVYYRVTARITGPRNTQSMVQAILSR